MMFFINGKEPMAWQVHVKDVEEHVLNTGKIYLKTKEPMNKPTKAKHYDKICNNCQGLVAKPNQPYGWGGTFCQCDEPDTSEVKVSINIPSFQPSEPISDRHENGQPTTQTDSTGLELVMDRLELLLKPLYNSGSFDVFNLKIAIEKELIQAHEAGRQEERQRIKAMVEKAIPDDWDACDCEVHHHLNKALEEKP